MKPISYTLITVYTLLIATLLTVIIFGCTKKVQPNSEQKVDKVFVIIKGTENTGVQTYSQITVGR